MEKMITIVNINFYEYNKRIKKKSYVFFLSKLVEMSLFYGIIPKKKVSLLASSILKNEKRKYWNFQGWSHLLKQIFSLKKKNFITRYIRKKFHWKQNFRCFLSLNSCKVYIKYLITDCTINENYTMMKLILSSTIFFSSRFE